MTVEIAPGSTFKLIKRLDGNEVTVRYDGTEKAYMDWGLNTQEIDYQVTNTNTNEQKSLASYKDEGYLLDTTSITPSGAEGGGKRKALDKCTVAELKARAKKRGTSLKGLTKKADIIAKLRGKK